MFRFCAFAVGLFVLLGGASAGAQGERPNLRAVALGSAPALDGNVLEDEAWRAVPAVSDFWQTTPFAGQPASERTEVRVAYTADTLFVGVVCFDSDPKGIIVSDSRRDASLEETDSFQVILDTFADRQNGFVFGTNPAGIEYDGQVANQGVGGFGGGGGGGGGSSRFRGGSGEGFNLNWDGAWNVAARIGDEGWSAELAIPFTTLRYPRGKQQDWVINFQRNIRRRNETAYWAKLDRQFNLYRLDDAGQLAAIEPPPQRNLKLVPYALGEGRRAAIGEDQTETDSELGLDLKYGITPSLTLDATYNTDFAQVEVDEQQVNLDRFNLFFPEKRPFFLENAGLFAVGSSGEIDLFFSRRIGIADDGTQIPIVGGVRLSGKVGRTNIGFLDMQTDSLGFLHANNFAVARVSRDLPNRSNWGVLVVNRQGTGRLAPDDDENRTYAVDGKWGIGEYHEVGGFAAMTETAGQSGNDEYAFEVGYNGNTPKWRSSLEYAEVGEDFNPEVGFLLRRGYRRPFGFALRTIRPKDLWGLQELRPHVFYQGYWDMQGFLESALTHLDNHWEWRTGHELHTGINLTREGVKEPFEIAPGVIVLPGVYEHEEGQLVFFTNQGAPFSISTRVEAGGFFGGDRVSVTTTLRARRGEALTSELEWSHNDVNLPVGDFELNLGRLRVSYSFTPRVLLQALVQYNDRTNTISSNLRFSLLRDANTGLFVVYDEIEEFGSQMRFARPDRSLIVKYSHLIDVFRGR